MSKPQHGDPDSLRDNFFDSFKRGQIDSIKAAQEESFQTNIVKRILRYAEVPMTAAFERQAKLETSSGLPDFEWFNHQFPRFPLRLLCEKIRSVHTVTIGHLYARGEFVKLKWWRAYTEQVAAKQIDLTVERAALLFEMAYAKEAGLMVLHNQPSQACLIADAECRTDQPWPRTTFPMKNGVVAVLEAFPSFMQTVGKGWVE